MKYSQLFGKTVKSVSKNIKLDSHRLLVQAGFIRESVAGRYFMLPLGMRVRNKIIGIIREEMDKSGAQEMITPVLHPLELWQESNRDNAGNFGLMLVEDRRGAKFALGGTAEEMFVDVVRKFPLSYKDLPFNIYQFSQKFRDELRARGGLLRVREFLMKDAYSFDKNAEEFAKTYETMGQTYQTIFNRIGLETIRVASDNGYIGGEYCHEYVAESEIGESTFLVTEDSSYCAHQDVATFKLEPVNPDDPEKPMEIIDQPEWVHTMEDNLKHYQLPQERFLKNVVYKNITTGDIIIAVIRGDLDVNVKKLEHVVNAVEQLEEAKLEDLAAIGTKPGYVHSWGHSFKSKGKSKKAKVIYVVDKSLYTVKNFIGGQKEETTDSINVNYGRDFKHDLEADIALAKPGLKTPDGKVLVEKKGIEVGNIFQLGEHYSRRMNATYTAVDGSQAYYYMGCYGIGVGRSMQAVVQIHHDERGIIWPESVAPFQVHLISIQNAENSIQAEGIHQKLIEAGIEVLWDDREDVSPGQKFADADLIGCPVRLVVSAKTGDKIELKKRTEKEVELLSLEEVIERLK
ncbi:proline--tRNA ligase [Candidatus Beckwithbacteria bacterium]|nr:proline--tRNA ligase [Candidatus Beckwithbacteria bacterium]